MREISKSESLMLVHSIHPAPVVHVKAPSLPRQNNNVNKFNQAKHNRRFYSRRFISDQLIYNYMYCRRLVYGHLGEDIVLV